MIIAPLFSCVLVRERRCLAVRAVYLRRRARTASQITVIAVQHCNLHTPTAASAARAFARHCIRIAVQFASSLGSVLRAIAVVY